MRKFLALGILAAVLFLVPSVQAQEWYGARAFDRHNYSHSWQGPHHWGQHLPPRWRHRWNHGNWHPQPLGYGNCRYQRNWDHRPLGWQHSNYRFR
jgi:hypothetical protein